MKIPALMYHDIVRPGAADASGFPGAAAAHYKLDTRAFDAHLSALNASRLTFPAITQRGPTGCLLTFDDGGASVMDIAARLSARGMRGHFFITTARIGQPSFATSRTLREIRAAGHIVGSHSHTHPTEISRLSKAELAAEWRRSTDCLQQLLGEAIAVASIPGGFYSDAVAHAAAAQGIRYLFTSEPVVTTHDIDGCLVVGRYSIVHDTPPERAVCLALGAGTDRSRQWLMWNIKKPIKRWARPVYRSIRAQLLGA
ncbi:MAG TPA: polysaccharide deacetylase family protein [Dyella sp.]|uniref:polysaccharide deacetylase family protein n=1 Tax=Dyella sp. TaxID=1869338 RepID=UPI002F92E2BE